MVYIIGGSVDVVLCDMVDLDIGRLWLSRRCEGPRRGLICVRAQEFTLEELWDVVSSVASVSSYA